MNEGAQSASSGETGAVRWLTAWVFLLVLALQPFTEDPAGPVKELLSAWVMAAAFIWLAVRRGGDGASLSGAPLRFMGLFLAACMVSAVASDHTARALFELRHWAGFMLAGCFAAATIRTADAAWRLVGAIIAAVACSSVYGLLQHLGWDPFPWAIRDVEEYRALPSTYANPNLAGHALVMATVLAVGALVRWRRSPARFALTAMALALILSHLYLTHMRAAQLALAAALLFVGAWAALLSLLRTPGRTFTVVLVLGVAALTIGGAWLFRSPVLREEKPLPVDSSIVLRANGYFGAAEMVQDYPLLGVGPGNYALENPRYWQPFEQEWYATKGKKNAHVHCEPLELALDAGLPGLGLYFAMVAACLLTVLGWTRRQETPDRRVLGLTLAAFFLAFSIDGLFGFNLHAPVSAGLLFLTVGCIAGLAARAKPRALPPPYAWAFALLAVLLGGVQVWNFIGEYALQRAYVTRVVAAEQARSGAGTQVEAVRAAARHDLSFAAGLLPWDDRPWVALGEMAREDKDRLAGQRHAEADKDWLAWQRYTGEAIHRAPLDPRHWARAAEAKLWAKACEEAGLYAERALSLCEPLGDAHYVLGSVGCLDGVAQTEEARQGRLAAARASLERAAVCAPSDLAAVQHMLGRVCSDLGDDAAAGAAWHRAVTAGPEVDPYWNDLERWSRGRDVNVYRDALLASLTEASEADPPNRAALATLAGRVALEVTDHDYDPRVAAAALYLAIRRVPDAGDLWAAFAEVLPGEERLAVLSWAWSGLKTDAALDTEKLRLLDTVLTGDPTALAQVWARFGRAQDQDFTWLARVALDCRDVSPAKADATAAAAQALVNGGDRAWGAGRRAEALRRYAEGARLLETVAPEVEGRARCEAMLVWSRALAKLDDLPGALARAREAAALGGGRLDVRWQLARMLAANGRTAEARLEYTALTRHRDASAADRTEMEREIAALARESADG